MMKNLFSFFSILPLCTLLYASESDSVRLSSYVNPFIGASNNVSAAGNYSGLGKTFPGATAPFGLVQVSPNTITGGDNGSGYSSEHTTIEGFAFTQMSGVGYYGDLGNFLVMPTTGTIHTVAGEADHPEEGYRSRYDKKSEQASAGYYAVHLTDYDIHTEATALPHSGMLRFTFPQTDEAHVQIDLARRVGGTSELQYIEVLSDRKIRGWMKCTPDGGGWGNGAGKADYTVYFCAEFSSPFQSHGIWSAHIPDGITRKRQDIESESYKQRVREAERIPSVKSFQGKHLGFYANFNTGQVQTVVLKAGISLCSMENAEENLYAEMRTWDFDAVREQSASLWDEALGKMSISGGTKDSKTIFYTSLYHTMIDPRVCSDVNGDYVGADHQIHHTKQFNKRSIFSGWDVFRSQMPLQTLINPTLVNDLINSLVEIATQNGTHYLERWELLNAYSGCMIGNPAISVLCDAYTKGIRDYDIEKAYLYAKNTSEKFGNNEKGYTTGDFSLSETLEYAYTDWCMAVLAKELGKKQDYRDYLKKSQSYATMFDPETGWFRPRNDKGEFMPLAPDGRLAQEYGCIESNAYQQGWFVPHDVPGLVKLLGGNEKALSELVNFFEKAPRNYLWNNYYNHANEPVHHVAFLFNKMNAPWLTQKWTRDICRNAYRNEVMGLVGNEDVGQMSAWYVLAATGLHPICPGDLRYEITSPVFDEIALRIDENDPSRKFVVKAIHNSPENIYIQKATLNGKAYNKCYLMHEDVVRGGTLVLEMGSQPSRWGME